VISLQFKCSAVEISKIEETEILLPKWYKYYSQFRVGDYNDAEYNVKKAWITFVDNILTKFGKGGWKSSRARCNNKLSDYITVSDEAYAMLISSKQMEFWVTQKKTGNKGRKRKSVAVAVASSKQEDNEDEEVNDGGGVDDSTTAESQMDANNYYDFYAKIQKKRKSEDEGKSWEIGFMDDISVAKSARSISSATALDAIAGTEQDDDHGGISREDIEFERGGW
jgi:hypothetical protein